MFFNMNIFSKHPNTENDNNRTLDINWTKKKIEDAKQNLLSEHGRVVEFWEIHFEKKKSVMNILFVVVVVVVLNSIFFVVVGVGVVLLICGKSLIVIVGGEKKRRNRYWGLFSFSWKECYLESGFKGLKEWLRFCMEISTGISLFSHTHSTTEKHLVLTLTVNVFSFNIPTPPFAFATFQSTCKIYMR